MFSKYNLTKKVKYSKHVMKAGKICDFAAAVYILLGVFMLFIGMEAVADGAFEVMIPLLFVALIFIGGAVSNVMSSTKCKKEAEEIKKYLAIIVNGNERQIDAIASSVGKTYDEVKDDIQFLITNEWLKDAYINEGTREVVLLNNNIQEQNGTIASKIVACPCCGANNTIIDDIGKCEYCGSTLR